MAERARLTGLVALAAALRNPLLACLASWRFVMAFPCHDHPTIPPKPGAPPSLGRRAAERYEGDQRRVSLRFAADFFAPDFLARFFEGTDFFFEEASRFLGAGGGGLGLGFCSS